MSTTEDIETNPSAEAQPAQGVRGTNPTAGVRDAGDEDQGQATDQSDGDEGSDEDPPAVETEEVEFAGKKFAIPKELKPALMLNADYTRKTQELAEVARQTQEQFAQREQALAYQAQVQQQHLAQYAQVSALDQQLADYGKVNWQQAMQTDPQAAQAAWMQFQQLKEQRAGVVQNLQASEQRHAQAIHQHAQQNNARGTEVVKGIVSQWSPETVALVNEIGEKSYGVRQDHFAFFAANPGLLPILHDAVQFQKLKQAAAKASAKPGVKDQPAPGPSLSLPTGSGKATPRTVDDSQSIDSWMKRRNAQTRQRYR